MTKLAKVKATKKVDKTPLKVTKVKIAKTASKTTLRAKRKVSVSGVVAKKKVSASTKTLLKIKAMLKNVK